MPRKFPPEFKRDVVRVARRGDLTIPEVAADFGISDESVRRWLRRVPESHAQWLYRHAVEHCARIDRDLLVRPAAQPTLLGHALNLLAGVAVRYRDLFGDPNPPWSLVGALSYGHLLTPPLRT